MAQPTAYVFRSAEDTLTFCYDAACATRNGDTWEIPEVIEYLSDVEWQDEAIQKVIIEPSFADYRPTSTVGWFGNLKKLTIIEGIEHLNTSCVTDMTSMFRACTSLTSLDVAHFDTSKVTGMDKMFCGCESLTSLDVSHFDTSKVTCLTRMFCGCKSLTTIDLSHFDTSQVKKMRKMFKGCTSLQGVDLSRFQA